jgi:predicted lysophospholipase L1 biosynthesis ABC-type transport system permease subunit
LSRDRVRAAAALAFAGARPAKGVDLRATLAPSADGALADQIRTAVAAAGGDPAALAAELDRRDAQEATATALAAAGFDPEAGSLRTIALVGLSLLVCVVGIVNTMMMAVTERFREIATMKCLGAPDGFILRTFLVESVFLGLVGSLVGLLLGVALVLLQAGVRFGGAFWAAFPAGELALTALAAVAAGLVLAVVGALIPALTAARMHPIEAMRVEQ